MRPATIAAVWIAAFLAPVQGGEPGVGSSAPAVEPTEWLNAKPATSWSGLKGRLVLVEKWATW